MEKKFRKKIKLNLNKTTLRQLNNADIRKVNGGLEQDITIEGSGCCHHKYTTGWQTNNYTGGNC